MSDVRGSMVVVWRVGRSGHEFLLLRTAGHADEDDWAWRPPGGCADAGEEDVACAARELQEETGLRLPLMAAPGVAGWPTFLARADAEHQVRLSDEHDEVAWLPLHEALVRCRPAQVARDISLAARLIDTASQ